MLKLTKEEFKTIVENEFNQNEEGRVHYNTIEEKARTEYNKEFSWSDFRDMIISDRSNEFMYLSGFVRLRGKGNKEKHYMILDLLLSLRGLPVRELYNDDLYVDSFDEVEQKYGSSYEITKEIFTYGNCGNVFKILQSVFPEAKPCLMDNHIITLIEGRFYDIEGEVKLNIENPCYTILDEMELDDYVNNYSFYTRGPII